MLKLRMLAFLVVVYFALKGVASWQQGYTWSEMDWNRNGSTTIVEFFAASDIGTREVQLEEVLCIEYYLYKDGLAVKEVCPK